MSGLDNSQPITEETVLRDVDDAEPKSGDHKAPNKDDGVLEGADADELGDATPGPR